MYNKPRRIVEVREIIAGQHRALTRAYNGRCTRANRARMIMRYVAQAERERASVSMGVVVRVYIYSLSFARSRSPENAGVARAGYSEVRCVYIFADVDANPFFFFVGVIFDVYLGGFVVVVVFFFLRFRGQTAV